MIFCFGLCQSIQKNFPDHSIHVVTVGRDRGESHSNFCKTWTLILEVLPPLICPVDSKGGIYCLERKSDSRGVPKFYICLNYQYFTKSVKSLFYGLLTG